MRVYGADQPPEFLPVEGIGSVKGRLDMEPIHSDVQGLPAAVQEKLRRFPIFVGMQPPDQKPDAGSTMRRQESHLMGPQLYNGGARVLQLDQVKPARFIAGHDVRHPRGRPGFKPRQTDPRPRLPRPIPEILPELPLPHLNLLRAHPRVH